MRQATIKVVSTLEDTDATFNASMPVPPFHEPLLVFMFEAGFGTMAALRQNDPLHAQFMSQVFIRFGEEAAISAGLVRWLAESFEVRFQTGFPLLLVTRVAVQDTVVAHQPTFDFIEPDLVSVFHRTGLLATTDNVGVLFKEAHDLFLGRHLLTLQDPPSGLVDDLLGAR